MKLREDIELLSKHKDGCPECGNKFIGNGQGTLITDETRFYRSCSCGWEYDVRRIQDMEAGNDEMTRMPIGHIMTIIKERKGDEELRVEYEKVTDNHVVIKDKYWAS